MIWCVGIPRKRKYKGAASADGHRVLIRAMKAEGVKRIIDWGTPSVPFEKDIKSVPTVLPLILASILFTKAKKEIVEVGNLLEESDLDWTMVRLKRRLPPMADSNFSKVLRSLEEYKLINRTDYHEVPSRVDYSLTEIGERLIPVMKAMLATAILVCKFL